MTSSILFNCSCCQARIKSPIQLVGQKRSCPGCGSPIIVPPMVPQDSGPVLTFENPARTRRPAGLSRA